MPSQAEANLAALIESTEDLIWSVGLDYQLVTLNQAARRNLEANFGTHPAIGMRPDQLLPPAVAADWPMLYERALKNGPFRTEYTLADGHVLEISLNRIVVDGETTGISVFGKDITERKLADKDRALLAAIVDSSDDAIHSVNLDGTIVTWNRGAEQLFGFTSAETIGKNIANLAPPGRSQEVRQLLASIGKGGSISPFDTVLCGKDGREIDVSLLISPVRGPDGEVVGASAIARDISRKKQFERALQKAERQYRDIFDGALEGCSGHLPRAISRL